MSRIQAALAKVADALKLNHRLLARAQRRYKANRKRAYVAHNRKLKAREAADKARAEGGFNATGAWMLDKRAARFRHVEQRNHRRAEFWLGRTKALTQRVHGLKTEKADLEADLVKWKANHEPTVSGNKVKGGDAGERFILANKTAAANCANGKRRNFYDQSGAWDCKHEIEPGPAYNERSDCSQYGTGICWSVGLPDPNNQRYRGGYTGTALQNALAGKNDWKVVSEKAMRAKGWGIVIYLSYHGDTVGHHWENYIGEGGDLTIGHGSAPVDAGRINLFGDGLYACLIHDPK